MENNLDLRAASFFLKPGKRVSYLLIIGPSDDQDYDAVAFVEFTVGLCNRTSDWTIFQGCYEDIPDSEEFIVQEVTRRYGITAAKFVKKTLDGYYSKEYLEALSHRSP